ncbi:hypothetical protein [Mastigocoleus testarum]|uniref:Uncharacterized protein n=1 Tax=Mastigocoleus testarum BC008 TaxID=371196 RepID=A0A0V7ZK80_9CYAN|nr:hypothetical protein [Mastigocoleus testarum]KST64941.1 hypothetical protein BC008_19210 [Mastigocoleus testarum BC008]KST65010.1 hypothetical protein BC008_19595 [Mastigocoleus testarum BC008]
MLSGKIAIVSLSAGIVAAAFPSFIDSIFKKFSTETNTLNLREIINRFLLVGCLGGWLIGIIFYAFAIHEPKPIQTIFIYSIIIGIIAPTLSNLFLFTYRKLFPRKEIT